MRAAFLVLAGLLALGGCATSWDHAILVDARVVADADEAETPEQVRDRVLELVRSFASERDFSPSPVSLSPGEPSRHLLFEGIRDGQPMQIQFLTESRVVHRRSEAVAGDKSVEQHEFREVVRRLRVVVTGDGDEKMGEAVKRVAHELRDAIRAEFGEVHLAVLERVTSG